MSSFVQVYRLLLVDSLKGQAHLMDLEDLDRLMGQEDLDCLKGPDRLMGLDRLEDPEDQAVQAVQLGLVEVVVVLEQASEHLQALPPVQTAAA